MSETDGIDVHYLHGLVVRESESDSILEIEPDFYRKVSNFIGNLRKQEFDGTENKIKEGLLSMTSELISLLLQIRLNKIISSDSITFENLLDEEKFILDAEEEKRERTEMIISATLHGKSKLLESISQSHKTKTIVVRFLQGIDEMVGSDLEKYGPFKEEDIATIPYENAQALISKKIATKVRWED